MLLLHPAVGMTKPGDVDHYTRVRTYKVLTQRYYDPGRVLLALVPLGMRLAGPRETVWHMVARRNCGANHLIVGRDHAGAGYDSRGVPFYGPYDVQDLAEKHSDELGLIRFATLVYVPDEGRYEEVSRLPADARTAEISGTQVREECLNNGRRLANNRRIGFVASEVVRHGGVVICAAVSPYRATCQDVRSIVGTDRLIEVFVDAPLEVGEKRDVKGLYAKARRGGIKGLTGIDDPYEPSLDPEITLDAVGQTAEENAVRVLEYLKRQVFVRSLEGLGDEPVADPGPATGEGPKRAPL